MSSNEYAKQDNQAVSNVDEFIIEAPEEDPNFDKLSNLVTVLENDIRKAHNNSISIEKVIMSIRNSAYESENSPMAEHVSLLYCHIAEENKAQQRAAAAAASSKAASTLNYQEQEEDDMYADTINLTGEIPFYLYSGSSKQIIGWEVLNRNVFYSRAATALFCFVAFVVMSCVPNVGHRKVNPNYYLEVDCIYKDYYTGHFNYVSYQYIIALCVIIFLHNALWIVYYILPVDTVHRKYVPGMRKVFDSFLNPSDVTTYGQRLSDFFNLYSKSLEPIMDGGFLAMLSLGSLIAAMNLEKGFKFYTQNNALEVYFSMVSFMNTFGDVEGCLSGSPVGLVRASLAMSFFGVFCLAFTFQVTFRSFLLERKRQKLTGGGLASQQLPTDSEDGSSNPRQPYESSSDDKGGDRQFVRV